MTLPRVVAPRMLPPRLGTALVRAATVTMTVAATVAAVRAARRRRSQWKQSGRPRQRRLTESMLTSASRQQVYWLCRDVPRLAQLVDSRMRVIEVDDVSSTWEVGRVACTVEITGDVPELLLSWQVDDGPVPHHGRLTLHPAGKLVDGGGTRIDVQVQYGWPPSTQDAEIDPDTPRRLLRRTLEAIATEAVTGRQNPGAPSGSHAWSAGNRG